VDWEGSRKYRAFVNGREIGVHGCLLILIIPMPLSLLLKDIEFRNLASFRT